MKVNKITKTEQRKQITNLDTIPFYDRSLVDYEKYQQYISHAGVKYSMSVHATRGCPYRCFYCDVYKTTLHHFRRSVDVIYDEVKMIADMGVKRVEFIDDIFNVKKKSKISKFVTNNKKTLAIRFPKQRLVRTLIKNLDYPLAAPSANISTKLSSVKASDVKEEFGNKIKFVLDGGKCKVGIESTIISLVKKIDRNLIKNVKIFDVYQGDNIASGKKSIAFNVTLEPRDKTLSEKDIDQVSKKIISTVQETTGATLRS
ncbi:MAG: Sua5/YciO/YrdC/YwlC family protein [Pelagibacteraceae bacterium]|nr:Sua5/YciO/YrdC/YwlC family protein [Pelagibacteraceae bacterium]MBO6483747.1 Sua5/YciO/YrdC/YwlC family protein [Pelagibacteraceae bacterium]MBO6484943.1 Sua5/YciO/YrdC/YwlC family protein [Pelagibacteraceae bacterium]MBO6486683.1 Sua5/YciO/YrdC/YwlC family protein [Pelagibacteraceae bacterium]MBO6487472.1 Sua5/YciO/YrdC/YwlC family protein [Pelagibacteraceae bacterium]